MSLSDLIVNYGTILAYIFLGVAILLTIAFPLIQMVRDFKKALKTLAGVGAIVLAFMVCYWTSAGEAMTVNDIHVAGGLMKIVEACLYLGYVMFVGAVLAVVITPLSRYIK